MLLAKPRAQLHATFDGPSRNMSADRCANTDHTAGNEITPSLVRRWVSTPKGAVSVRWTLDATSAEPAILFQWKERGGPPATPPKRKGFGTVLLERAVPTTGELPHFDYSQDGFTYELRAALAQQSSSS